MRHWEDQFFFCIIWSIKWFKSTHGYIIHSKSFPTTPHTLKSDFKRRSYVINKLEKKTSFVADFVAIEPMTRLSCDKTQILSVSNKLYRYKTRFCRNRVINKLFCDKTRFCHDRANDKAFLRQNPYFVATELATNSVATKPDFVATE